MHTVVKPKKLGGKSAFDVQVTVHHRGTINSSGTHRQSYVAGINALKIILVLYTMTNIFNNLSYDVASGSEITPCNKIDKPLVVYRFMGNVMTSITTLRT